MPSSKQVMFVRETKYALPTCEGLVSPTYNEMSTQQQMQNLLQNAQFQARIYNTEIEPEHDTDYYCNCTTHQYTRAKMARLGVHDMWSKAVKYPGRSSIVL